MAVSWSSSSQYVARAGFFLTLGGAVNRYKDFLITKSAGDSRPDSAERFAIGFRVAILYDPGARPGLTISILWGWRTSAERSLWRTLMPSDAAGVSSVIRDPTPDGLAYIHSCKRVLSDLYLVDGVK